jgi:hypothetical protein
MHGHSHMDRQAAYMLSPCFSGECVSLSHSEFVARILLELGKFFINFFGLPRGEKFLQVDDVDLCSKASDKQQTTVVLSFGQ